MELKTLSLAICGTGAHCRTCCDPAAEKFRRDLIAKFDCEGMADADGVTIHCRYGGKPNAPPPRQQLPGRRRGNARRIEMPKHGPGAMLHAVLSRMGYRPHCGCHCEEFAHQMNVWGWWACAFGRRQEIIDWLAAKAAEQSITVDHASIIGLMRSATKDIRRRRQKKRISETRGH